MGAHVPTSLVLRDILVRAPSEHVTLGWLLEGLHERSFGLLMFLLALVALVPGLSTFVGLLLAVPAMQMMLARHSPVLPAFVSRRRMPTRRLEWMIARIIPMLRWIETLVRPRWTTPFEATKRAVGFVVLLLAATLVGPIPFSHVIPALAIMLIALAYLEEDGVMLMVALAVAALSLAITGATVWATVAGVHFLERQ